MANTKLKSSGDRRQLRRQREELVGNRLLLIFCIAALGLLLLSIGQNKRFCMVHNFSAGETAALWALGALSAAVLVIGALWHFIEVSRGRDPAQKAFNGFGLAAMGLTGLVSVLLIAGTDALGYRISYLFVSFVAGIALCRVIFNREFFAVGSSFGLGAILFYYCYMLRRSIVFIWNPWKLLVILFGAAMLLEAAFFALMYFKKGMLGSKRLFPAGYRALIPCAAALLMLLCCAAALVLSPDRSVWTVYASGAGLAAGAIYYAVKLI